MGREILLVRHFEDLPSISYSDRDSDIIGVSKDEVDTIAAEVVHQANRLAKSQIVIITSPLKRAIQTSTLLQESILKIQPALSITTITEPRVATLKQGDYINTDFETMQKTEKRAWAAFEEQALGKQNIYYRHGDALIQENGTSSYPELARAFNKPGENQLEFTTRTYSFILDLIDLLDTTYSDKLVVISGHVAPLLRLLEMESLSRNTLMEAKSQIESGKLYIHEWNQMGSLLKDNPDTKKLLHNPGSFTAISLDAIKEERKLIEDELKYLRQLPLK